MVRCVFSDFDAFADAISGLNGRYIPTARSSGNWWIDPMRVGRLRLQRLQVGAAATFAGDGEEQGLTIGLPLTAATAIRIDGRALADDGFILVRSDRPLTYSAPDVTRWAGVTIPMQFGDDVHFRDAAAWCAAALSGTSVRGDAAALRRLSLLVALMCSDEDTVNLVDSAAVAAAEEEVVIATANLLRSSNCEQPRRIGRSRKGRDQIIARCLELCRENPGRAVLVADLCRAAEVSERTLRNVFQEYFGVGPVRFLRLRQLQEVRSALLNPVLNADTVGAIAGRFGVWDLSAFARDYRTIYGELPSHTLRSGRPFTQAPTHDSSLGSVRSWMQYAAQRFARNVL